MDESIQWFVWDGYTVLVTLLEVGLLFLLILGCVILVRATLREIKK